MKKVLQFVVYGVIAYLGTLGELHAQTSLKVYTGSYKGGSASYQYYEDENDERVYHGIFQYESGDNKSKITGYFKNNEPDSIWKYIKEGDLVSVMHFDQGSRVGKWSYIEKRVFIDKRSTYKYTANIKLIASFSKNDFDGDLYFSYISNEIRGDSKSHSETNLMGVFKDGLMNGEWSLTGNTNSLTEKYINGIFYYSKKKDIRTGEVKITNDSTKVFECLCSIDGEKCQINGEPFKVTKTSNSLVKHTSEITDNLMESSMNMLGHYVASSNAGSIFTLWGFKGWMGDSWDSIHSLFGLRIKQFEKLEEPTFPIRWVVEN